MFGQLLAHVGIGAALGSFFTHAFHLRSAQAKGIDKVLHLKAGTTAAIDEAVVPSLAQQASDAADAVAAKVGSGKKLF